MREYSDAIEFFEIDKQLEALEDAVLQKRIKLEFGNPLHIELVKYTQKRAEYKEWEQEQMVEIYEIEFEYSGKDIIKISAVSRNQALLLAEKKLESSEYDDYEIKKINGKKI